MAKHWADFQYEIAGSWPSAAAAAGEPHRFGMAHEMSFADRCMLAPSTDLPTVCDEAS